jgi:hypothetical protein
LSGEVKSKYASFAVDGTRLLGYHMKTITLKEVVTFQISERNFEVLQVNTHQKEATKTTAGRTSVLYFLQYRNLKPNCRNSAAFHLNSP